MEPLDPISVAYAQLEQEKSSLSIEHSALTAQLQTVALRLKAVANAMDSLKQVTDSASQALSVENQEPSALDKVEAMMAEPPRMRADSPSAKQLTQEVRDWSPSLPEVPLEEVYAALTLRKDRFTQALPSSMDLSNSLVVRCLENHLRHERLAGYYAFCARLKQFERLGFVYKMLRDKANAAIYGAYPALAAAARNEVTNPEPQAELT